MGRVVDHQTRFMAQLMGGPSSYDDEALRRLHARLPIDDAAFDDMTDLLRETLEDLELDPSDAGAVVREIELRRPLIVNPRSRGARPPSPPRRHEPRTPVRGVARVGRGRPGDRLARGSGDRLPERALRGVVRPGG
jgi:hypothetical protein